MTITLNPPPSRALILEFAAALAKAAAKRDDEREQAELKEKQ